MESLTEILPEVLLALNGDLPSRTLLENLRPQYSLLLATDGAAGRLIEHGIVPDVVIGDMDSVSADTLSTIASSGSTIVSVSDQDRNDFEKALEWIVDGGYARGTIVGIAGGWLDHTLNNMSVLSKFAPHISLRLLDDYSVGYVLRDSMHLDVTPEDRVSLIPLPKARITTTGLVWELLDEELELGVREGASNRAVAGRVGVSVHEGTLLLMHFPVYHA